MRFLDFLFPLRVDEALLQEVSTDDFLALLRPRLISKTNPSATALLPFDDTRVRASIHEAKYHGSKKAFELLGNVLAEYLRDYDGIGQKFSVVPVPLGQKRHKKRKFNQVEEVVLCALHTIGKDTRIEINSSLLIRTRETASQVSLPRHAREENMRGAFGAAHPADPSYTYIILDDVLTTGATLQAAIDALKQAGAEHIVPIALAH